MITINNFEIINQASQLAIDVQTEPGFKITSVLVWTMDNFKDYSLAKDFTSRLEQVNNREVLIVTAGDLNVRTIEDLVFVEIESDYVDEDADDCCEECDQPAIGIAYDMSKYYRCLMSFLLDMEQNDCATCKDNKGKDITVTVNLMIDTISKAIDSGFYLQAIDMITNLKKICDLKNCKNCEPIICKSCNQFKQH